ncbi:MAG: hypothetical protein KGZ87_00695, partial [Bacteroidetes bacterium]|nr:hypothetical protein [Bacteroidota bacterium]
MNFINHLNEAFKILDHTEELKPVHIALYMALFRHWNKNRFKNPLGIIRDDLMEKAKINSITTYYKVMKDLQRHRLLTYLPSYNPYTGTSIFMQVLTSNKKKSATSSIRKSKNDEQNGEVYIYNKNNKTYKHNNISIEDNLKKNASKKGKPETAPRKIFVAPTLDEIALFFIEKNNSKEEAERFYNYYSSNGWLVGGKT